MHTISYRKFISYPRNLGASLVHVLLKKSAARDYHKYVVSSKNLGRVPLDLWICDLRLHRSRCIKYRDFPTN